MWLVQVFDVILTHAAALSDFLGQQIVLLL